MLNRARRWRHAENRIANALAGDLLPGTRQCFGDRPNFQCPNSGIRFGVSFKRFYAPVPKPGDDMHAAVPDVPVNEEMPSEYRDDSDPLLAFALDHVRSQ